MSPFELQPGEWIRIPDDAEEARKLHEKSECDEYCPFCLGEKRERERININYSQ